MNKEIFQLSNKAKNRILVVANSIQEAESLAVKLQFVKKITNLSMKNITLEYVTPERVKKGLDLSKLKSGQLYQVCLCGISTWHTNI
jgi:hypothetical protein